MIWLELYITSIILSLASIKPANLDLPGNWPIKRIERVYRTVRWIMKYHAVIPLSEWCWSEWYKFLRGGITLSVYSFSSVLWHCWLGDRKGIRPVKHWVLVLTIWLELCTSYGSNCHHYMRHPWLQYKLCTRPHDMPPPLYAARCSPVIHALRLWRPARLAPWIFITDG